MQIFIFSNAFFLNSGPIFVFDCIKPLAWPLPHKLLLKSSPSNEIFYVAYLK